MRAVSALLLSSLLLAGCLAPPSDAPGPGSIRQAEDGVPVDGYPNYQERLMLVAINRARAEPNSVDLGTAGACSGDGSTPFALSDPLVLNLAGSKATRFNCANCLLNDGGLSHDSYCSLRSDIAQTGCDGSLGCACEAGSDHFNCTTGGGHGTDPWTRASLFGYSANGEVGAVGYSDGWAAVAGWVTECPDYEGHRRILLDADQGHTQIGLGYAGGASACWPSFFFGDTNSAAVSTPRLPAGVHRPETGSNPTFYLNAFDPGGGARSVDAVVDGTCHSMSLEAGTPENGTYLVQATVGAGCHQYWFLVRDAAGARHTYPSAGAWGCGSCTDYQPAATEADCENSPNDGGLDDGLDGDGLDGDELDGDGSDDGGLDDGGSDDGGLDGGGSDDGGSDDGGLDDGGSDGGGSDDGLYDGGIDGGGSDGATDAESGDDQPGDSMSAQDRGADRAPVIEGGCACGSPGSPGGLFAVGCLLALLGRRREDHSSVSDSPRS